MVFFGNFNMVLSVSFLVNCMFQLYMGKHCMVLKNKDTKFLIISFISTINAINYFSDMEIINWKIRKCCSFVDTVCYCNEWYWTTIESVELKTYGWYHITLLQIELCIIITSMNEYWFLEFRIIMFFICKNQNWNKIM